MMISKCREATRKFFKHFQPSTYNGKIKILTSPRFQHFWDLIMSGKKFHDHRSNGFCDINSILMNFRAKGSQFFQSDL